MKCLRCELIRAKLYAIICYNTTRDVDALMSKLNTDLTGAYFYSRRWHPADGYATTIFRFNDNPLAPNIEIWSWNEPERQINIAF